MTRQCIFRILLTTLLLGLVALIPLQDSQGYAEDLIQDYCSAHAWWNGEDPYQNLIEMRRASDLDRPGNRVSYNPHPPLAVLLTVPFSNLPLMTAWRIFEGVQLLALSIAWNWAGCLFGFRSWRYSILGGFTVLWTPIWQGLDWGQPVGTIALVAVILWSLSRQGRPVLCGAALCAACLIRPFFFLVGATAARWSLRQFLIAAFWAAVTMIMIFATVGVWPWVWMQKASEAGQFTAICGSLPGVLGLHSKLGTLLFFATTIPIAIARRRWADPDPAVALALTLAMLTYTHAWFQYDASLIPVVIWIFAKTIFNSESTKGNQRLALWLAFLFGIIRSFPNIGQGSAIELWIQVAGRVILLVAVILVAESKANREVLTDS